MGGFGSGGNYWGSRRVLESRVPKVSIFDLKPEAGGYFIINGVHVDLEWTDCNYGGQRAWFVCPYCRQRKGVLYLVDPVVRCRECFGFIHHTKRVGYATRAAWRASAIRGKLGWEPRYKGRRGYKPKWMRWATYDRLVKRLNFYEGKAEDRLWRELSKYAPRFPY